jgi:uncharacterized membrane protein YkvA (DUF1232 family)
MDKARAKGSRTASPLRRARRRRGGLRLAVRYAGFLPVASRIPMYARLVWALVRDDRVPNGNKAVLALAGGYILLGRDLIPDSVPIVGALDDLAVVVLALEVFFENVPEEVLAEKLLELGIDPDAFQRDMDQVRRLTPAPVRNLIRRLPSAIDAAGRLIKHSGVGPKVRSWVTKEESFA